MPRKTHRQLNKSVFARAALLVSVCILVASMVWGVSAWVVTNRKLQTKGMAFALDMPRGVFATSTPSPATLSSDLLDEYDFVASVGIRSDRILNPVSTADTENWYVPVDVLPNGDVNAALDGDHFILLNETQADECIIDQTFYIVNTYAEDVTLHLSKVNIVHGTGLSSDSDIYKAVRVAVTVGDNTTVYRVTEGAQDYGAASPVTGVLTTGADPSIPAGEQPSPGVTVFLPAAKPAVEGTTGNMTLTTETVNVKIWIEGQNPYAVAAYAGTAFRVSLSFITVG